MRNYFYILLLLCTVKTIAQEDCFLPRTDGIDFNFTTITNGKYFATNEIIASSTTIGYTYLLSNSIILKDGFKATATGDQEIKAGIQNCTVCKCVDDLMVKQKGNSHGGNDASIVFNPASCATESYTFDWFISKESDSFPLFPGIDSPETVRSYPIGYNLAIIAKMANGCSKNLRNDNICYYPAQPRPEPIISPILTPLSQPIIIVPENIFTVYPNPSSGIFTINGGLIKIGMQITVTDYYGGQTVLNTNSVSDNEVQIDLTGFKNGFYFARFFNQYGEVFTAKLVKE